MKHIGFQGLGALILLSLISASVATAQQECTEGQAASVEQIFSNANEACCSKTKRGAQNKCLRNAIRSVKRTKAVISKSLFQESKQNLAALRSAQCELSAVEVPSCSDDMSTTTSEAIAKVEGSACSKKFQSDRTQILKKTKRSLNKARKYLGTDYVNTLKSEITNLQRSKSCGRGGEDNNTGCSRIVNPRDGANGNVYKLSDHGASPVFVTHDGSRSGTAITKNGQLIQRLNYTGLANRDPQGLRHHYRLSGSCSSLPSSFYLKLGGTCYEINDRCGRID